MYWNEDKTSASESDDEENIKAVTVSQSFLSFASSLTVSYSHFVAVFMLPVKMVALVRQA